MTAETADNAALELAEIDEAAPPPGDRSAIEAMLGETGGAGHNVDALQNVGLSVRIVLGQTRMAISQLLKLSRGSVIELDKKIGQPVDVVINDRLVARGDLIKLKGERIGVSLTEIVKDYVPDN
jgi:flagellar motor switch protein FliN/FliY